MESIKYIGMDVHKDAIAVAVMNSAGKVVTESILETKAATLLLQFIRGLRGNLLVTFEEGTWATWLYDLLRPYVTQVTVCNPRKNAWLRSGNKGDRIDAQKLAELLRHGSLSAVYHGERGLRTLRELSRSYLTITKDLTRAMNRLKALYHSWGRFRTRVLTRGVDPMLCCYYKSSRLKQYFKEGRALRTETVIGDTKDFGIGRRVWAQNWYALRAVGESANRCLCDAEAADAQPAPDVVTFSQVTRPSTTDDGLCAPGLRFGEARVMALLGALVGFCHFAVGFCNREMVERVRALGTAPYTTRQATYDLRRLKRKGLIAKRAHTHRYQLTSLGRRVAVLFTKTYGRVLAPGLSALDPRLPEDVGARSPLTTAWRTLERTLDDYIQAQLIAA